MGIKKLIAGSAVLITAFCFCGCQSEKEVPDVHISVWSSEQNLDFMKEELEAFSREHENEVKLKYTVSVEGEDTCRDVVISNPEKAADIFFFADDQTDSLINAGALLEITEDSGKIIESSGGSSSAVADVITRDGKVYAYPYSAGNGYFLYYNRQYFSENDVKSLDTILEKSAENGKIFTMNITSGWYLYSFFKGAGLNLNVSDDGTHNICNWNATDTPVKGADVAESILRLAGNKAFVSMEDDGFVKGVQDGTVAAGINGPWNSEIVKAAWGENYAAAKLPEYAAAGRKLQMASFSGYKLAGINAGTDNPEWCMKFLSFITNEENQIKHFEKTGECPANVKAGASEEVLSSPAIAALSAQSGYSCVQRVADPFWEASNRFGITMSGCNSGGRDIQTLLDELTEQITAPVEQN